MYSPEFRIANAALTTSIQLLRMLVEKGVLGPDDVDEFAQSISSVLENASDGVSLEPNDVSAHYLQGLDPLLARIRQIASQRFRASDE